MKWLALLVIGVLGCGSPPPAQRPTSTAAGPTTSSTAPVKYPEMLAMMERYLMSPFSGGEDQLKKIGDFVIKSHDVLIEVDELAMPFLMEDLDDGVKKFLMIGFMAGNVASQLRAGIRRDDLIAGMEGELQIYLQLKALSTTKLKDFKVISPNLDALLVLQGRGELRAHLERARSRRKTRIPGAGDDGTAGPALSAPPLPGSAGTGKGTTGAAPAAKTSAAHGSATATAKGADNEELKMVRDGIELVKAGHPEEAITGYFDKVIASYEKRYAADKRHIYCGHDHAEALLYMVQSANNGEDAVSLAPTWAEAWYYKSYALTELHRDAEALSALDKAITLSPSYTHYLSERGYLYHKVKDWQHSLEMFKAAEEGVKLIADRQVQIAEHTRALRGQGYSLVELGDLDAAEQKYQQSLALNPDDTKSKQELDYIKDLRAKRKP